MLFWSSIYTGCFRSPVHCLNFEQINLEYYNRYNGKIKIYIRFGYGKSIALGFSSISIVILKIYAFKVQTVDRTYETPCISWGVLHFVNEQAFTKFTTCNTQRNVLRLQYMIYLSCLLLVRIWIALVPVVGESLSFSL